MSKCVLECCKLYEVENSLVNEGCPFIDPLLIDEAICMHKIGNQVDYVSTIQNDDYPSGQHVEVFAKSLLEKVRERFTDKVSKEHVTPGIYSCPEDYSLVSMTSKKKWNLCRLTVDYQEDMNLVEEFIAKHPKWIDYTYNKICELIMMDGLYKVNEKHIECQQKTRMIWKNHK